MRLKNGRASVRRAMDSVKPSRGWAGLPSARKSRLHVDGREVAAGRDAAPGERGLHPRAIRAFGEADHVDKPTDFAARERQRRALDAGDGVEESVVARGDKLALREDLADAAQLHAAESAGQLGKPVAETWLNLIEPIEAWIAALITEAAQARGVGGIVGQHGAALAGGHLLIGIEGHDGEIAEAADAT